MDTAAVKNVKNWNHQIGIWPPKEIDSNCALLCCEVILMELLLTEERVSEISFWPMIQMKIMILSHVSHSRKTSHYPIN